MLWRCAAPSIHLNAEEKEDREQESVSQSYTPPSMEDGPTRTHTLHTIGSGADTRHAVTGRSTGSGLLDAQHTAHRTAHEVALYSGVLRDRHRRRRWGTGTGHRTHELISQPAPGAVARASAGVFGPAVWPRRQATDPPAEPSSRIRDPRRLSEEIRRGADRVLAADHRVHDDVRGEGVQLRHDAVVAQCRIAVCGTPAATRARR